MSNLNFLIFIPLIYLAFSSASCTKLSPDTSLLQSISFSFKVSTDAITTPLFLWSSIQHKESLCGTVKVNSSFLFRKMLFWLFICLLSRQSRPLSSPNPENFHLAGSKNDPHVKSGSQQQARVGWRKTSQHFRLSKGPPYEHWSRSWLKCNQTCPKMGLLSQKNSSRYCNCIVCERKLLGPNDCRLWKFGRPRPIS